MGVKNKTPGLALVFTQAELESIEWALWQAHEAHSSSVDEDRRPGPLVKAHLRRLTEITERIADLHCKIDLGEDR